MIAMIVANRNDWLWENHLSDWSGGNGSLWRWRGTSEGHEWGQQSNTTASQVHTSLNTKTQKYTITKRVALVLWNNIWGSKLSQYSSNWTKTTRKPTSCTALPTTVYRTAACFDIYINHCALCGAGIIHKCHLLAGRVGGAPSGAPQQDSMNFLHRPTFFIHRKNWKKRCLMMMEMWSVAWLCFKQMAPSRQSFAGCHY